MQLLPVEIGPLDIFFFVMDCSELGCLREADVALSLLIVPLAWSHSAEAEGQASQLLPNHSPRCTGGKRVRVTGNLLFILYAPLCNEMLGMRATSASSFSVIIKL